MGYKLKKKKKKEVTSSVILRQEEKSLMGSVWFGLCDTWWQDSLLLHPVGLGTQDETEKILIWNRRSFICRRRSGAPLIVQPGALKHREEPVQVILADG